jgi:hypothetical protein
MGRGEVLLCSGGGAPSYAESQIQHHAFPLIFETGMQGTMVSDAIFAKPWYL